MLSPKKVWLTLFGDLDKISSEKYFVTITSFVASIFLLVICFVHLLMGLKLAPVILAATASLTMIGLYFFLRFGKCLFIPKLILTVLGLFMLDLTWYFKFLSNGPVLFFILIFAALVIWVWEGKALLLILTLYFVNLAVLGIIESNAPDELLIYTDPAKRGLDIYLSFFLYSSLLIILLYIVKREFYRQRDKAMKSDKMKSAFIANMSHEIRTPMNAILGFSQLMIDDPDIKNQKQYLNIIQNSGEDLLRLINDIIDLSKLEADDIEIMESDINIQYLFEELQKSFTRELQKRDKTGVHLSCHISEENIVAKTDSLRLRQVLSNLISNAVKFTERGSIVFSCEPKGKELVFSVADTGVGMPKEDQPRIFDRFTKFDYQGLNHEGTGIGLAITARLIALLKGKIWFDSIPGKGSTFHFSIPYKTQTTKLLQPEESGGTTSSHIIQNKKLILVVEDNEMSYCLIMEALKPLNLESFHVTDGKDAIDCIRANPDICLVLMDIKLPFMDGYEASKEIKKIKPELPIIAQSAFAMIGDMEKALNSGCDDYITKPLDVAELKLLVKKYI